MPRPSMIRDDDGANAVEFALVLPILLVLIFGTLTGGLTLFQKLGVEQGAREGARWGATYPLEECLLPAPPVSPPADCWFAAVANRTVSAAGGELADGVRGRVVCVAYIHDDGTPRSKSLTWDASVTGPFTGANASSSGSSCFDDGITDLSKPRVQVEATRLGRFDLVFYGSDVVLRSEGVALFEPEPKYS